MRGSLDQLFLIAFDSIAVSFEMFIVHMYLSVFFERKADGKAWLLPYFLFGTILVVLSRFSLNMYVHLIVTFSGILLLSLIVFSGSVQSRIYSTLLFCLIAIVTEITSSGIISVLAATKVISVNEYGMPRIISSILANLLCLLIIKIINVFIKRKADPSIKKLNVLTPLLIFLVFSIFLLVVSFTDTLNYRDLFSVISVLEILAIVYMNIMVFWYYDRILRTRELQHEKEAMEINTVSQVRYYEIVQKQQDALRSLLHDAKKHEAVMERLAGASADPRAEEYLKSYRSSYESIGPVVSTPDPVVSLILSDCAARAAEMGIRPDMDIRIAGDIQVDPVDLTVILGNTIENALRALSGLPEGAGRELGILLRQRGGFLAYDIRNSYTPTKGGQRRTGYGLRNVEKCVKKYRGEMTASGDGAVFTISITLQTADR